MSRTTKQWTVTRTGQGLDGLVLSSATVPPVGEHEVLVRLHAASLNYRDLMVLQGNYPFPLKLPFVAASDGAGEVAEVGGKVTQWKVGDRVVTLFNQAHQHGAVDAAALASGLGGFRDGTLRQWAVFPESGLVASPRNLSHAEAATLTCAALTSWNALFGLRAVKPGDSVLVQGSGGVSVSALQLAKAAGAVVIATTSSAGKAEALRRLGADHVINYREDEEWGQTAKALTKGGAGVDHIVEVGGLATFRQSLKAVKYEGVIAIVGALGGMEGEGLPTVMEAWANFCTIRGIAIGSRAQMVDMVAAIEANDIHPIVDKVFEMDKAYEAYEYMFAGSHFGKVVISLD